LLFALRPHRRLRRTVRRCLARARRHAGAELARLPALPRVHDERPPAPRCAADHRMGYGPRVSRSRARIRHGAGLAALPLVDDDTVRHLLPEIYHGNPLSRRGSLVFTDFGWEVLAQLRAAGLSDAALYVYWGYELGYLGIQFYFLGHKAPPT